MPSLRGSLGRRVGKDSWVGLEVIAHKDPEPGVVKNFSDSEVELQLVLDLLPLDPLIDRMGAFGGPLPTKRQDLRGRRQEELEHKSSLPIHRTELLSHRRQPNALGLENQVGGAFLSLFEEGQALPLAGEWKAEVNFSRSRRQDSISPPTGSGEIQECLAGPAPQLFDARALAAPGRPGDDEVPEADVRRVGDSLDRPEVGNLEELAEVHTVLKVRPAGNSG